MRVRTALVHLYRVILSLDVGNVESHFNEGDRGVLALVELQGHLILAGRHLCREGGKGIKRRSIRTPCP